ncbi:MAG: Biotin carboxylase of acetyl-CoA carboxylase / Biotin carboxyl carrier protein of acetyl-CoA carboxylase, partial [uncultured Nocardioides sp.]
APAAGFAEGPHRQPWRDRRARRPRLQGRGDRQCRGVRRPGPRRAVRPARRRGSRPRWRDAGRDLPRHHQDPLGRRRLRGRLGPPRLRLPGRERRVRPGRDRRRPDLDRTSARGHRGLGGQGQGQADRPEGRRTAGSRPEGCGRGRRGDRRFRSRQRPAGGHQGRVRRRWSRPQGGVRPRGHPGALRVGRARGRHGLRSRRVPGGEVPRQAASRRDPVPGRPARQRRGRLDPRLLAAASSPEARRGGARAVPDRGPGDEPVRVLQGHPQGGRLRRCRHLRVPGRCRRHHLLPRGQHPAPGRALRLRGGHRHRPGPRDVPHRRRGGAGLRRPGHPWPLHRVPHQRRGRWPQLHAGP